MEPPWAASAATPPTLDDVGAALLARVAGTSVPNALLAALQVLFGHQLLQALDLVDRQAVVRLCCPASRIAVFQVPPIPATTRDSTAACLRAVSVALRTHTCPPHRRSAGPADAPTCACHKQIFANVPPMAFQVCSC